MSISDYEKRALHEIHDWKDPNLTWWDQAMKTIQWPLSKAGDFVVSTPGLGPAIVKAMKGLVSVVNDAVQWTVRTDAIHADFRKQGHDVRESQDIFSLDLKAVDEAIGRLDAKYKSWALAEGALTGATGAPGLVVNVPALLALNLRAIGEYATYCGFELSSQRERLFAMNIMAEASSPGNEAKVAAMAQLVRIAHDVAKKKTWKELEKQAFVVLMQRLARTLGVRLTKAKPRSSPRPARQSAAASTPTSPHAFATRPTICTVSGFLRRSTVLRQSKLLFPRRTRSRSITARSTNRFQATTISFGIPPLEPLPVSSVGHPQQSTATYGVAYRQNQSGNAKVATRRATLRTDAGNHANSRPAPSRDWAERARTPRRPCSFARFPTTWHRSCPITAASRSRG